MAEAPVTGQRRPTFYGSKRSALTGSLAGERPALAGDGPAQGVSPGYRPAVSLVPRELGRKASSADWISVHINLLRVTDSLLIAGAVALGYHLASPGLLSRTSTAAGIAASVALALIWIAALEIYRTRDPKVLGVGADEYKRVISATFRLFGLIAIASVVFSIQSGATMFAVALPVGTVSLTANRWLFRRRLATEKAK
ncbi:MAG: polyprenyl glycosylphosphotransferase, partial [Arthrobacter sp.]|nr:polyprenyl glycosylphosphotransferase [Arthrobacter sp.]